jgi:hypothetical protein
LLDPYFIVRGLKLLVAAAVGTGRLRIYDQAPKDRGRGAIHHLG